MDTNDHTQQAQTENTAYIERLIDEKFADKKENMTAGLRNALKKDLSKQLDDFMMARMISEFSDEEVAEFEKLINEGKTREDMRKYASEHVEKFEDHVADALIEFAIIYMDK